MRRAHLSKLIVSFSNKDEASVLDALDIAAPPCVWSCSLSQLDSASQDRTRPSRLKDLVKSEPSPIIPGADQIF